MPLLEEVKRYLKIDWEDEATDLELEGMILRGKFRLCQLAGSQELDFEAQQQPKALLLDYCRYARSHALELFEKNFQDELLSLNFNTQLDEMGNEDENQAGD